MEQNSKALQQAKHKAKQAGALPEAATQHHSAEVGELQVKLQRQEQAAASAQESLARVQQAHDQAVAAEQVRLKLSNTLFFVLLICSHSLTIFCSFKSDHLLHLLVGILGILSCN